MICICKWAEWGPVGVGESECILTLGIITDLWGMVREQSKMDWWYVTYINMVLIYSWYITYIDTFLDRDGFVIKHKLYWCLDYVCHIVLGWFLRNWKFWWLELGLWHHWNGMELICRILFWLNILYMFQYGQYLVSLKNLMIELDNSHPLC